MAGTSEKSPNKPSENKTRPLALSPHSTYVQDFKKKLTIFRDDLAKIPKVTKLTIFRERKAALYITFSFTTLLEPRNKLALAAAWGYSPVV